MSTPQTRTLLLIGYVLLALSLVACQRPTSGVGGVPESHGGPVRDQVTFIDSMRALGYTVSPAGDIQQPFLRPTGTVLHISGAALSAPADLQAFNYDDRDLKSDGVAAAQADVDQIQPDGQPKTARISWTGPPHLFHKDRVIVIYVGSEPRLLATLTEILGPQFAGQQA